MIAAVFSVIFWIIAIVIALAIIAGVFGLLGLIGRAFVAVMSVTEHPPPQARADLPAPRATPEDLARIAELVRIGQEKARRDREKQ